MGGLHRVCLRYHGVNMSLAPLYLLLGYTIMYMIKRTYNVRKVRKHG